MKKRLLLLALCIAALSGIQVRAAAHNPQADAEKAAKHHADSIAFTKALHYLQTMDFIIEPTSIEITGYEANFTPNKMTNFVCAHDGKGTIQIVPEFSNRSGQNGMGGITTDGPIKIARQRTDKKGNVTIEYNVMGKASATVRVTLPKDGVNATVRISSNSMNGTVRINGNVVPFDPSSISIGASFDNTGSKTGRF